jgi:SNF2 family DNA or RNA helicase
MDEDGVAHEVGTSKRRLLHETLDSLDSAEPTVVFCRFHSDLDTVKEVAGVLGRGCLELSGRVNQLEDFKDGGGPIIAVQIQSGGVGVDLSRAAYTIYFSPTYDGGAYEQSLRRTRRPTKHKHATFFYYHLVAENTIDVAVYQALKNKRNMSQAILAGIRGIR